MPGHNAKKEATYPEPSSVERLALVQDRRRRMREIRRELAATSEPPSKATQRHP